MIIARVINNADRAFNVRLVRKGDRYGLNDCLVHDKGAPLVEFWDATYENDPRFTRGLGQFVSRYYLSTLTDEDGNGHKLRAVPRGIALCDHEPVWTVTGANVADAIAAAEAVLSEVLS